MKPHAELTGISDGNRQARDADSPEQHAQRACSPGIERILLIAFGIFMLVETLEAPLRYALTLAGAPWLVYLRDAAMMVALLILAVHQIRRRELQMTFILCGVALVFYGVESYLQCGVSIAVLTSMKTLLNPIFGAIFLPILIARRRGIGLFLGLLWLITAVGIVADHQGLALPWKGLSAEVGDYKVVINRQWSYYGADRIGGFARDSVGAAMLAAFPGVYVLVFSRSVLLRLIAASATLILIYMTTTKGAVVAYALVITAALLPRQRTQFFSKVILLSAFTAMLAAPVILPQFAISQSSILLASFYDRIDSVWPNAWHNIAEHSWIFGSGLGNIGVGQQFLRFAGVDTADNLFLLSYGYFGIFCLLYLGWAIIAAMRRRVPVDVTGRYAIMTLIYIFAFGIVSGIIEGPVSGFMLGSALQALALRQRTALRVVPQSLSPTCAV